MWNQTDVKGKYWTFKHHLFTNKTSISDSVALPSPKFDLK